MEYVVDGRRFLIVRITLLSLVRPKEGTSFGVASDQKFLRIGLALTSDRCVLLEAAELRLNFRERLESRQVLVDLNCFLGTVSGLFVVELLNFLSQRALLADVKLLLSAKLKDLVFNFLHFIQMENHAAVTAKPLVILDLPAEDSAIRFLVTLVLPPLFDLVGASLRFLDLGLGDRVDCFSEGFGVVRGFGLCRLLLSIGQLASLNGAFLANNEARLREQLLLLHKLWLECLDEDFEFLGSLSDKFVPPHHLALMSVRLHQSLSPVLELVHLLCVGHLLQLLGPF